MSDSNPVDQNVDTSQPSDAPIDPNSLFADQLAEIKAHDGRQKYSDVETALGSIPHAQARIDEQAQRIKDLEAQVAKQQGINEVIEQLKHQKEQSQQQPVEQPSNAGIDETTVAQLLDQRLQQRDMEARQQANASQVLNQLKEKFGDKAEEQFNSKAQSLGMTAGELSHLARTAPKAVLAYFDGPASNPANPTQSSVNTNVLDSSAPEPDNSHMNIFTGGNSPSIQRWRAAKPKT